MTKEQIQKEIQEMNDYLPVYKIEERLGMPPTTLQKVLKGERGLPKKWLKVLEGYFNKPIEEVKEENIGLTEKEIDEINKKIEAIKAEKVPSHRDTKYGKITWQQEQWKKIEELQKKLKDGNL